MGYINRRLREELAVLATIVQYCEDIAKSEDKEFKKSRRTALAMARNAQKIFDAAIEDIDTDQLEAIIRISKGSQFSLVSKASPRAHYDTISINKDIFDRLVLEPVGECSFCTKSGADIKSCQRRKDLAHCGVVTDSKTECPYQG